MNLVLVHFTYFFLQFTITFGERWAKKLITFKSNKFIFQILNFSLFLNIFLFRLYAPPPHCKTKPTPNPLAYEVI